MARSTKRLKPSQRFSPSVLEPRGYGLFISHNRDICGLPDPCILFFEREEDAIEDGVAILVKLGAYIPDTESSSAGRKWSNLGNDDFYLPADVLEDFQQTLGASEYFHVYPLHELKQVVI